MTSLLLVLLLGGPVRAHNLAARFERAKFKLGSQTLDLWIADTDARRGRGLMFVDRLDANEGMLFVFDREQPLSFWMKNTLVPLAIGFFDEECRLREVIEMSVAASVLSSEIPSYRSAREAKFALEMKSGWFGDRIKPGAKLTRITNPRDKSKSSICK